MQQLSETSLTMKTALEGGGEGFDALGEKAAAARGEVQRTEQAIRRLNAADALQNLRDTDHAYSKAVREAQGQQEKTSHYGEFSDAYNQYMEAHPSGYYKQGYSGPRGAYAMRDENFYVYAKNMANVPIPFWESKEKKAELQATREFWSGVLAELDAMAIDASSSVEEIGNKVLEFDIAAASYMSASESKLKEAWQLIFDDLYTVMTDGTDFSQLPQFMQDAAVQYYDAYIGSIDQQAELAEGDMMRMAGDLTGYVDQMTNYLNQDADFAEMIHHFDELMQGSVTQESVDEMNAMIPMIKEFITAYNGLTETTEDDIPLFSEFTLDGLTEAKEGLEGTGEALATLKANDIYKDIALAKEEANGFATVLSKLGDGEDRFLNLHDAVMMTAQEIANGLGITDSAQIEKIGEKLLEGLYDTYPDIVQYVDTATGMLVDGWQEGVANATNPWAEMFKQAKLADALKQAKRDMTALDASSLWDELLKPDGKGLYEYAEDWARELIPDGTEEEIHAQAEAFVSAFFEMFADVDTTVMDGEGRINAGMEGIIAVMRKAANAANAESTRISSAYKSLHADTLARNEAIEGLTGMAGFARSGDQTSVNSTFEALSAEAINAITDAMPSLIDKLNDGTASAEDFEQAMLKIREAEDKAGKDAWKDYFGDTAAGLKQQSALWSDAMRGIITEVSAAEDKESAFYQSLIRLSNEGVDVSGMLDQYGALGAMLLDGATSADELYAA